MPAHVAMALTDRLDLAGAASAQVADAGVLVEALR